MKGDIWLWNTPFCGLSGEIQSLVITFEALKLCFSVFIYLTFWVCSLQEDPPAGVSGAPSENNIMVWNAVIFG